MNRRAWTADEDDLVRTFYLDTPAHLIGDCLGRSSGQVQHRAGRLGLRKWPHRSGPELAAVRRLHARGLNDGQIAAELGWPRRRVTWARGRALGLPVNAAAVLEARRRAVRTQAGRLGIEPGGKLRAIALAARARRHGWPDGLRWREVQVLDALWERGPMTRAELAGAIGMRTDRTDRLGRLRLLAGNGPGGSYVATLLRRGLIAVARRARQVLGRGKGRSRDVYLIPLHVQRGQVS